MDSKTQSQELRVLFHFNEQYYKDKTPYCHELDKFLHYNSVEICYRDLWRKEMMLRISKWSYETGTKFLKIGQKILE